MPEARLPIERNSYRFAVTGIAVIAELPAAAAEAVRAGLGVTVTVEWEEI